jgi:hypothetical protein
VEGVSLHDEGVDEDEDEEECVELSDGTNGGIRTD